MRWALVRVALATTTMVALAFLVPLALIVHQIAEERAVTDAERQASAMVTVLAITTDRPALSQALRSSPAGQKNRLALHLPFGAPLGTSHARVDDVALAADRRRTFTADASTGGGQVYLQHTTLPEGADAVIEVYLPEADLTRGVTPAWVALSVVALTLVLGSVFVADRLGAKVVGSARGLAKAARAFGSGDLKVRVDPGGPPELAEAGKSFNTMAARVVQFLDAERELAADLAHRTPARRGGARRWHRRRPDQARGQHPGARDRHDYQDRPPPALRARPGAVRPGRGSQRAAQLLVGARRGPGPPVGPVRRRAPHPGPGGPRRAERGR